MLTVAECMMVVSLKVVALVLSLLSSSCHKHGMKVRRVFAAKHLDETLGYEMKSIRLSHRVHIKLCCVCLMVCVFIPPPPGMVISQVSTGKSSSPTCGMANLKHPVKKKVSY